MNIKNREQIRNDYQKDESRSSKILKIMGIVKIIIGIMSFTVFATLSVTVFKNTFFVPISLILGVVFLLYGISTGVRQYTTFR